MIVGINAEADDRQVLSTGSTITREIVIGDEVQSPGIRQITKFPVANAGGEIESVVTVSVDITDRKKAEQDLRQSEERFRDFAEASSDVMWELDANLRFSYISDRYYELTGRSSSERLGELRDDSQPEAEWESWKDHQQTLRDHLPFRDYVFARAHRDGRTVWFSSSGVPVFGDDGAFEGYRGTLKDISREVETQQALRDSEGLLNAIVEYAPMLINLKGLDGQFILANPEFSRLWNIAPEKLIGSISQDFLPEDAAKEIERQHEQVIATGMAVETDVTSRCPNGEILTRHILKFPIKGGDGEIIAIGGFGQDITERKRAEDP